MEKITLRDLQIGDKFYPASKRDKATPIYQVHGEPEFNSGHGSATRRCINLSSNYFENKSCRLEVVRTGKNLKVSRTH